MNNILIIAGKELKDGLRNRWVASLIILLAGLALALASLGSAPVGNVDATRFSITITSLASLSVYFVPLIALMISHDAIVGEYERGTLLLLMAYPITRTQLILGKFLGHLTILTIALTIGYGLAFTLLATISETTASDYTAALTLIATSILLGAIFILLGYIISLIFRERTTAAGAAIGIWLFMVILYDLALLGLLMSDTNHAIGKGMFSFLMNINPSDAFRIFNLSSFESARAITGLAVNENTSPYAIYTPIAAMLSWILATGTLTLALIRRYTI